MVNKSQYFIFELPGLLIALNMFTSVSITTVTLYSQKHLYSAQQKNQPDII